MNEVSDDSSLDKVIATETERGATLTTEFDEISNHWERLSPDAKVLATNLALFAGFQGADLLTTKVALQAGAVEVGLVANFVKQFELGDLGDVFVKTIYVIIMSSIAVWAHSIKDQANFEEKAEEIEGKLYQYLYKKYALLIQPNNVLRSVNTFYVMVCLINLSSLVINKIVSS